MEIKDILGIEPVLQAGLEVTKASISGVSSFLSCVCKPACQELGFLIQDKVRQWRLNNIIRTLDKARGRMCFDGKELQLMANARVGLSIMDGCSQVEDDELQDLWAGLFLSSCTPDGKDDSNMNFVDLLIRMSSIEAKILEYACPRCKKYLFPNQLIMAEEFIVSFEELSHITGTSDIYRLDCELDHMRSIELLQQGGSFSCSGGFVASDEELSANITPSALALNLFVRTHSMGVTPIDFWRDSLSPYYHMDKKAHDVLMNTPKE